MNRSGVALSGNASDSRSYMYQDFLSYVRDNGVTPVNFTAPVQTHFVYRVGIAVLRLSSIYFA